MLFAALLGGKLLGEGDRGLRIVGAAFIALAWPAWRWDDRHMLLAGIDFTSRPTRRKPITVALGGLEQACCGWRASRHITASRACRPGCAGRGRGSRPATFRSACRVNWWSRSGGRWSGCP